MKPGESVAAGVDDSVSARETRASVRTVASREEHTAAGLRQIGGFLVWAWSVGLGLLAVYFSWGCENCGSYRDPSPVTPWTWIDAGGTWQHAILPATGGASVALATVFFMAVVAGVPRVIGVLLFVLAAVPLSAVALATLWSSALVVLFLATAVLPGVVSTAYLRPAYRKRSVTPS
jgi:hypothetical protein